MEDVEKLLKSMLDNIAEEHRYENHVTSIQEISTGGANYSSRLYLMTLSAPKCDDLKLFAKVPIIGDKMRMQMGIGDFYDTEIYFYTNLLKRYQELENKYSIEEKYKLNACKFYKCNKEYLKEVLVLEDLSARGFTTHNRFKSIDWEYASKSVLEMAKFHALSIALRQHDPAEYERLVEKYGSRYDLNQFKEVFDKFLTMAFSVINEENLQRLKDFLEKQNFEFFTKPLRCPVLAHGDFRPSNIMHRVKENGEVEIVVLDYQGYQISNPILDLMYFIFSGSDGQFRARHYRQLLDYYYSELSNALRRLQVEPEKVYSKKDFEYELNLIQPLGLIMGIFILPVITVHEENAPSLENSADMSEMAVKPNELAKQRLNEVVDDFIAMGLL